MSRPKRREQERAVRSRSRRVAGRRAMARMDGPSRGGDLRLARTRPREALAKLVGQRCNLDDLIADIVDELRARPYELVFVAGGWQFRTRSRFAGAIRAANAAIFATLALPN